MGAPTARLYAGQRPTFAAEINPGGLSGGALGALSDKNQGQASLEARCVQGKPQRPLVR